MRDNRQRKSLRVDNASDLPKGGHWPPQGHWTYADYFRLPDDGWRYEVIRGVLYATSIPSLDHQFALSNLLNFLAKPTFDDKLGVFLPAPFEVILPDGLGDPVQPDIVFIRQGDVPCRDAQNFQGIPGLLAEVLSPESETFDRSIKLAAYRDAGVPEVWLVDLVTRTVEVFGLAPERPEYILRERRGVGETVESAVLSNVRVEVAELFWPRS